MLALDEGDRDGLAEALTDLEAEVVGLGEPEGDKDLEADGLGDNDGDGDTEVDEEAPVAPVIDQIADVDEPMLI